ncbi:MAG: heavy-metal-associated domain-containing protein [Gammaproteobacteria bacterium]|nr:heavy-metal-associated domain-containing protein [Gammaproteobacteria bacterium]
MNYSFEVENIKCGGCASSIKKRLLEDARVSDVAVDVENGLVSIESVADASDDWRAALLKMGYPESGTAAGIAAAKAKAKSFVSCAIGKVDNAVNK